MTIEEKDFQVKTSSPGAELDTSVAFLQIPTRIKDRVKALVDEMANEEEAAKLSEGGDSSPFQSSGCFFVISLEKIEQMHNMLRQALDPNVDDIDRIRAHVNDVLTALQGQ